MHFRPYEDRPIYFIVVLFNATLILTLMSGVLFYSNSTINKEALAIIILFLNFVVIFIFLLMIISAFSEKLDIFSRWSSNKQSKPEKETELSFVN